jgi:hypothetical protein
MAGALGLGLFVGRSMGRNPAFDAAIRDIGAPTMLLGIPLAVWLVILVHELGHVLAARLCGWRFLLLLVGPLRVVRGGRGLAWSFNRAWPTWGGLAASLPREGADVTREMLAVVLGGPLASLALAGTGLLLSRSDGPLAPWGLLVGVTSLLIAAATMLPMSSGGFQSDGAQALALVRGGDAPARRARRMALILRTMAGQRPRDTDPAEFTDALAEATEPRDQLALWLPLLHVHVDRGDLDGATRAAREVGARIQVFPDGMRQMVALDLAWFWARHGRDAAAARDWLAQASGGFVDQYQRPLAAAGLAWLEGRDDEAREALAATRRALPRAMDPGAAQAIADQVDALAQDLAGPRP